MSVTEAATAREEIAALTSEIDELRASPFSDEAEHDRQMADISFLQLRRRHLKARLSRVLGAGAGAGGVAGAWHDRATA